MCYVFYLLAAVHVNKKAQRAAVLTEQVYSEDTKRDFPPPVLNK